MKVIQTLLTLIPLMVLADAAIELATAPGICSKIVQIMDGDYVTQTLCYVKQHRTSYQARQICEGRGMRLAQPNSSPNVLAAVIAFAASDLKSPRAEVFVSGRTGGRCQALTGDGKLKNMGCAIPSHFLCEFFQPITALQCSSYNTRDVGDPLVNSAGISSPQTCAFTGTIANIYAALSTTSSVAKERVVIVSFISNTNVAHLPAKLSENFPNLYLLQAPGCRLTKILPQQFQGLSKLTLLDVSGNLLTTIDSNVFKLLPMLKLLNIAGNPLTTLSSNIFTVALPLLESLTSSSAGCISRSDIYVNRAAVAALPGSSTTCTLI